MVDQVQDGRVQAGQVQDGLRPRVPGYAVLAPLGEGASSSVWRARREADGLAVALKVLHPAPGRVEEGLREGGLLSRLRHAHLVHLYDVVPVPDPASGRTVAVALAMQLAPGGSLGQLLSRRRMLSPGEVVTVLQPMCAVLTELHNSGVVHGDLSVGNIVFLRDGMPLLADLGASRVAGQPHGEVRGTDAGSGMVAPEVLEGFAPTAESDVYSLGALAWLCLVGEPPGPAFARPPLVERSPDLPGDLVAMVERTLAPQPEDRPDADELGAALVASARPEPVEVAPDADPGHRLTERIRQQALADEEAADAGREGRRWRGALRFRERVPGAHREPESEREPAPVRGWLVGGAVAGLVLLGIGGAMAAGVLPVPWGTAPGPVVVSGVKGTGDEPALDEAADAAPTTGSPAAEAPAAQVPPAEATATGPPLREASDGAAVSGGLQDDEAVGVLQHLVDLRASAWEKGDPGLLDDVMAPGSPALSADTEQLERLRAEGITYADVTFRVDDARVVEADEGRLTVEAVVSRAPLVAFGVDGQRSHREMRTDEVVLVLARPGDWSELSEDGGWRLWSWGEPSR